MPLISVIVPVYNTEKYLHRCIDSILTQTFTDFELLLIDDGSTDSSGAICDEYALKDSRVQVLHKKNGGVSSARNLGLDNAQGEWITFVDSDDELTDDALFNLLPYKNVDLCVGSYLAVGNEENDILINRIDWHISYVDENNVKEFLSARIGMLHFRTVWGKLFKKSIIKKNKIYFDETLHLAEDTVFVTEYLLYSPHICLTDKVCYKYTGTGDYDTFLNKYTNKADKALHIYKRLSQLFKVLNLTGSATDYIYFIVFDLLFLGVGHYIIKPQIMADYLSYDDVMKVMLKRLSLNKRCVLFITKYFKCIFPLYVQLVVVLKKII